MWKKILSLSLIFGISLAILVGLSVYAFQRFNAYVGYADAVDRHHQVLTNVKDVRIDIEEMENTQRGFLLFRDSSYYAAYGEAKERILTSFGGLVSKLSDDESQSRHVRELNIAIKSHQDFLQSVISLGYAASDRATGIKHRQRCISLLQSIEKTETTRLERQMNVRRFYETTTPKNFRIVFMFTIAVFIISFALLIHQYRSRLSFQQKLEKNVMELDQANDEWKQIAYVASHDLQEPIRKIRTFTNMLQSKHAPSLNEDAQTLISRIEAASARAQLLVLDIVHYNMIVYTREVLQPVDLNSLVSDLADEWRDLLAEKGAAIRHHGLPVIRGYPSQLALLFRAIFENSVKFSKPAEPLSIVIATATVESREIFADHATSFTEYYKITIEDNGIGFENQFAEKMFRMFQRLHPHESNYEGRGIGLAMVKRIMTNHMGLVTAWGQAGKGARITLYFPVR